MPSMLDTRHFIVWTSTALSILGGISRPFKLPEAVWPVAGALILVVAGLPLPIDAWHGVPKGLDVTLFLIGMLGLAEISRRQGLVDWLANLAVRHADGSASRPFVLVEALDTTGVLAMLAATLKQAAMRPSIVAGAIGGLVVALGSNVVNNLPAGLIAGAAVQAAHVDDKVAGAILVGVDLGPNLPLTGPLAVLLWLTAIRRQGEDVSFRAFLKLGLLAMPPALAAALAALLLP